MLTNSAIKSKQYVYLAKEAMVSGVTHEWCAKPSKRGEFCYAIRASGVIHYIPNVVIKQHSILWNNSNMLT